MERKRAWLGVGAIVLIGVTAASLWFSFFRDRDSDRKLRVEDVNSSGAAVEQPERAAAGSTRPIASAPLPPRSRTHAAWSGKELLVWSGAMPGEAGDGEMAGNEAFEVVDDGAAYDPATDSWRLLPAAPISGRAGAAAVWAGDRLVVWGGFSSPDEALDDGAAYVPDDDTWMKLPPAPLSGRGDVTAAWTGREVLIVGGAERAQRPGRVSGVQRDGAAYDPVANRWRLLPPIPDGIWPLRDRGVGPIRERFAGTWTGDALLVWGRDIALYDPTKDAWERISAPSTSLRLGGGVKAIRVGGHVVVIGLVRRAEPDTFGLTYESASGAFGSVPGLPSDVMMTAPRQVAAAGEQAVVLLARPTSAAIWRPGATTWQSLPPALGRGIEAAVAWTGDELLVWGGSEGTAVRADGIAWTP